MFSLFQSAPGVLNSPWLFIVDLCRYLEEWTDEAIYKSKQSVYSRVVDSNFRTQSSHFTSDYICLLFAWQKYLGSFWYQHKYLYYDIRSTLSFDPLPTHSEACSDLNVMGQCYVIILNELCQPQKGKYHIFHSLMDPRLYKYIKLCMHRWQESKSQHILEEQSGLMGEEGQESGRQQGMKELCPNYIPNLLENGLRYPE